MMALFNRLRQMISKPILFGIYAAIGGLSGALLGEILLKATHTSPISQDVVLLIDTSGSMSGSKLAEVKAAAWRFVQRQDLYRGSIAVVGFDSQAYVATGLTSALPTLENAIQSLVARGATRMEL